MVRNLKYKSYEEAHRLSLEDPETFWGREAEKLFWYEKPQKVLEDNYPFFRWFVGGKTNICYNAVDRHALGSKRGTAALIWESPETGQSRVYTFYHLYKEVNRFAGVLKNLGIEKGDRIIIYMPMVPEAVIAMLACVRIGAIHSVVFAGFSREALAGRIDDAKPKLLLCCEAGSRGGKIVKFKGIVDDAIEHSETGVGKVVIYNRGLDPGFPRTEGRDLDWAELLKTKGMNYVEPERLDSTDPSYILYTSGTTGMPKGVVRDTGGYMVALHASMKQIYDCEPDRDVYFSTSDIGWVVGHSYIVYAPLIAGIPSVLYEGTPVYPDPGAWWRVMEKYGVTVVFSAPTALRILKKFPMKWMKERDLSSLRYFFLAGEPLDEPTYHWAAEVLGTTIIDHYWQTESGWSILANMPGIELLPIKPGSPTKAAMGYDLLVVDEEGNELPRGEKGTLVSRPPLPPGTLMTIYGDDERYKQSYWEVFPGKNYYYTGDYAIRDEDGYFFVLGRADEVIKIAGHRLGTREIEEAVSSHEAVAETSCVGVDDEIRGTMVVAFVILREGIEKTQDVIKKEIIQVVRDKVGPIAAPKAVEIVQVLPKTRSGKIMRRVMKGVYSGKELGDLSTIEDGASIDEVKAAIDLMKGVLGKT
ncbi:MAG: acetate--CoA ligase [Candidatus Odinarchaeota archaeon]